MRFFLLFWLVLSGSSIAQAAEAPSEFSFETYKASCNEQARIYASCANQQKILSEGLAAAKAQNKLAVVIFGFNDCPPCKVMDLWMHTEKAKAAFAPYQLIELSIFDPSRDLRPEVFAEIIPSLKMPINNKPPYGVPSFAIVDPATKAVVGKPITGFDADDQSEHLAYLAAHSSH